MVFAKTSILNVPMSIVLDESGNDVEHESGARLSFNGREVQSYKIDWNKHNELVLLLKSLNHDVLMRGTWECFFKALSMNNGEESFSDLSKDIYVQSFLEHFHKIEDIADTLWKMDNKEIAEDVENDFVSSDECYYDINDIDDEEG